MFAVHCTYGGNTKTEFKISRYGFRVLYIFEGLERENKQAEQPFEGGLIQVHVNVNVCVCDCVI